MISFFVVVSEKFLHLKLFLLPLLNVTCGLFIVGPEELAQWLRVFVALAEDPSHFLEASLASHSREVRGTPMH